MKTKVMNKVKGVYKSFKAMSVGEKVSAFAFLALFSILAHCNFASAAGANLNGVVKPIVDLINSFITPLMALVGAGGAIFCIFLGVKYATAEEPQEREKRKQALKNAIIGFVLIFVLIVALRLSIKPLTEWMNNSSKTAKSTTTATAKP